MTESRSSSSIVVCEDDADTLDLLVQLLDKFGYRIRTASNGAQGKQLLQEELPDLLLTDIMMPQMSGIELVRWLRETYPEEYIPVLMITALDDMETQLEGFSTGADDYLRKPFHFHELRARVEVLLRTRTLTKELVLRFEEIKARNEELQALQAALIEKERELVAAQMAATTAHKLGQPITAVLLNCHALEGSLDRSTEFEQLRSLVRETVNAIQKEMQEIRTVLQRLKTVDTRTTERYIGSITMIGSDGEG